MANVKINQLAAKIKAVVTDVDGVLTDGWVFIRDDHAEPFGKFSILDGFAITMAHECGLKVIVLSGRKSLATEARCYKLGMDLAYTGISDKRSKLIAIATQLGLDLNEIAYVGDDLIDLPAMQLVGFKCAPINAVDDVKQRVDYVTKASGGNGVLREIIELILRTQGTYAAFLARYTHG